MFVIYTWFNWYGSILISIESWQEELKLKNWTVMVLDDSHSNAIHISRKDFQQQQNPNTMIHLILLSMMVTALSTEMETLNCDILQEPTASRWELQYKCSLWNKTTSLHRFPWPDLQQNSAPWHRHKTVPQRQNFTFRFVHIKKERFNTFGAS